LKSFRTGAHQDVLLEELSSRTIRSVLESQSVSVSPVGVRWSGRTIFELLRNDILAKVLLPEFSEYGVYCNEEEIPQRSAEHGAWRHLRKGFRYDGYTFRQTRQVGRGG
jgi:hypothetical protein